MLSHIINNFIEQEAESPKLQNIPQKFKDALTTRIQQTHTHKHKHKHKDIHSQTLTHANTYTFLLTHQHNYF